MSITTGGKNGRLGNQIIRNICISLIAEKHNLKVQQYCNFHKIRNLLGIPLYVSGRNSYSTEIEITDENFFTHLDPAPTAVPAAESTAASIGSSIQHNINGNESYFQTKDISSFLYSRFFRHPDVKTSILSKNPYFAICKKEFAATAILEPDLSVSSSSSSSPGLGDGGDGGGGELRIYIHVRLTDVASLNPGIQYYEKAIMQCLDDIALHQADQAANDEEEKTRHFFLASDDFANPLIMQLANFILSRHHIRKKEVYYLHSLNEIQTLQFGSICRYLILSHGSFSAITGYMAFFAKAVYYPSNTYASRIWFGDMLSSIPGWTCIAHPDDDA